MNQRTISELIDTSYLDYSMYVLESRAIPSMIDGFKPSQRKALFSALRVARSFIKTAALTGETLKQGYHHGDASMNECIGKLAATWNNNAPILEGEGSFGNRFDKAMAAPRYTSIRVNKNFDKFFCDNDILTKNPDPEIPEPIHYLPLIPWVLVNGTSGIAIGFATNIQPRDPRRIAEACVKAAKGLPLSADDVPPAFLQTRCKVGKEEATGRWYVEGLVRRISSNEILIEELPPSYDRKQFVARMDKLLEANKIADYEDECGKGSNGFKFRVKFRRGQGPADEASLIRLFGLREILSENLTVIDENGKLKQYSDPTDLIKDFVAFRIGKVKDRFDAYLARDTKLLFQTGVKIEFIKLVVSGKMKFLGRSKADMIAELKGYNIGEENAEMCLRMPISNLCDDKIQELEDEWKQLEKDILQWKNSDPASVYEMEVKELAK